ncbi:hypothetical protein ACHQM5_006675 [Ranunculus cassubicifolius]
MEQEQQHSFAINAPPPLISLTQSITPSTRRLSSQFSEPTRPINSGRLIGAEEASLGKEIKGGLSGEEIVAWDLYKQTQIPSSNPALHLLP